MKKYILALLPIVMLGACTKDLTSLNTNPKLFPTVPAATLFTQAQRILSNTVTNSSVNVNTYRLIEQQWEETTYNDESNYDINTRNINGAQWNALYRDVLNNLKIASSLVPTDATISVAQTQKNDIAISDIMQVYAFYYLVTTFGDVPYTQAFDPKNNFPKYDDAATIYKDLLSRLNADIAVLTAAPDDSKSFGSADLIYAGNVVKWRKFANSFLLKMGMTISDYDASLAKTSVAAAYAGGVFDANADNATYKYVGANPNTNPIYVDIVQSGRNDYVGSETLIDKTLLPTKDPRISKFFTLPDGVTTYAGGPVAQKDSYNKYAHVNPTITAATFPGLLLDNAEVQFYLSEAVTKGYISGAGVKSASDYYTAGVTASVTYWGADPTAAGFMASIPYSADNLGTQKWVADYNRGWDAWIETRRLDVPKLIAPTNSITKSGFPNRLNYPITESNVNATSYNAASAAIGGDKPETKLFFDKH